MDTGQRLVDRMPNNPKIIAFESTQHRFEVPLRPEQWSSYATTGGHVSSPQQQPTCPISRKRNASYDSTSDFMDVPDRGRKKTVRRKSNLSDSLNKDSMNVAGTRRPKKLRPSHRSSRAKNVAADKSKRVTDYFQSPKGIEVPHRPNSGGTRSHTPNVRCNPAGSIPTDHSGIPQIHVPRMRDLMSTQLEFLSGSPLQSFLQIFYQFDLTLLENTRAIHSSLCNIVRAPFHLAEQCRPVIDEIIAAQRSSDPNIAGEPSRRNHGLAEDYTAAPHKAPEHVHGTSMTPTAADSNDVNREDNGHNTLATGNSDESNSSHDMDGMNILFDAISEEEDTSSTSHVPTPSSGNHVVSSHLNNPSVNCDETTTEADIAFPNKVGPKGRRAGNRMTRKPDKFCSPFKYGVMSRPPPNVEYTLKLLSYVCAADSPLRSTPVIQFGTTTLSGATVAQSFSEDALVDPIFMNGFIKCVSWDDYLIRPQCHGYRVFLDADVSAILNVEWSKRDYPDPKYSESAALAAIGRFLPFSDLKKVKLILLPVLHRHHWSVYCVNIGQSRIDVLDSMDYSSDGANSFDSHHEQMGKTIMQRLSDALSKASHRKLPSFIHWRHVKVNVPFQKSCYDSAFFAMKFLEFYDGDGRGSLKADIATDRSKEQRAEMLYYLTYHAENKLHPLPDSLM